MPPIKRFSVSMDADLYAQLLGAAQAAERSIGAQVRFLVREQLLLTAGPLREREACARILAAGGPTAPATIRGPIRHVGFTVWHFAAPDKRGRVRCQFRNVVTGKKIPNKWELYWEEEPLEQQQPLPPDQS